MDEPSASSQIDAIIRNLGDWRGQRLSELRELIRRADGGIFEEVKWKKPSNPAGVPVWSRNGIVCVGEALKNAVRLTFPKGALASDPKRLFNRRLTSDSVRAIDILEGEKLDEAAITALIREAVRLNAVGPPRG